MGERFAIIPEAVFTSGTWGQLSGGAVRLYGSLALHADASGRCWPSQTTLARLSGIHQKTLARLLKQLVRAKLVTIERTGGGRSRPTIYKLETPAPALPFTQPETPAPKLPKGSANVPKPPRHCSKTPAPALGEQQRNSKENSSSNNKADAAADSFIVQVLEAAGIRPADRARIARQAEAAGMDALAVAVLAMQAKEKSNGNAPGLLIRMIEGGDQTEATPERVWEAINTGLLAEINGKPVAGRRATWNEYGVKVDGQRVFPPDGEP